MNLISLWIAFVSSMCVCARLKECIQFARSHGPKQKKSLVFYFHLNCFQLLYPNQFQFQFLFTKEKIVCDQSWLNFCNKWPSQFTSQMFLRIIVIISTIRYKIDWMDKSFRCNLFSFFCFSQQIYCAIALNEHVCYTFPLFLLTWVSVCMFALALCIQRPNMRIYISINTHFNLFVHHSPRVYFTNAEKTTCISKLL